MGTTPRLIASRRAFCGTHEIVIRVYYVPLERPMVLASRSGAARDEMARLVAELLELADALANTIDLPSVEPEPRDALLRTSEQLRQATERARPNDMGALQDLVIAYSDYRESVVRYLRVATGQPEYHFRRDRR